MTAELKRDLMRDEGLGLKPYTDTAGKITIGFGRNLDSVISKEEAFLMLGNDVCKAEKDLARSLPWWCVMGEGPKRAICTMCFNLGIRRLFGFRTTLAKVQAREFYTAALEALDSKWGKQVGDKAERIAALIRSGGTEMLG